MNSFIEDRTAIFIRTNILKHKWLVHVYYIWGICFIIFKYRIVFCISVYIEN